MSAGDSNVSTLPFNESPFFDSRLNQGLTVLALVVLAIVVNGYQAMRFDHLVQLPYVLMQEDPSLYARDWYLQTDTHDRIRYFHLLLIRIASVGVGLETGLLAPYLVLTAATFACWIALSKQLTGSSAGGVIVSILAIFFNGWELGANHLYETSLIPRTEAYVFCYAGLALLLSGRAGFAGLLFGLGGLFQPAVPLQFAGVMALWLLVAGNRPRAGNFLKFAGAYWAISLPWMLMLRGTVTGESSLTDSEITHIFAFIRHPAHMLPFSWPLVRWGSSVLLLLWFAVVWSRQRRDLPGVWRFGTVVPLIVGILAVSTFFIELYPVRWIVVFQPFRSAVLLYLALFVVLSPELVVLFRSESAAQRIRAVAMTVSVSDPRLLFPALLLYATVELAKRRRQPVSEKTEIAVWVVMGIGAAVLYPWLRRPVMVGYILAVALVALHTHPSALAIRARRSLSLAVALGVVVVCGLRLLPVESRMQAGREGKYNFFDRVLLSYQFKVVPVTGIERMAAWVEENTDKDALFVIPPERQSWGFRLFARRSQVFDVKSIPYTPGGMEAWWERLLAHRGVFDSADPAMAEAVKEAWEDKDTAGVAAAYASLTSDQLTDLIDHYQAEYAISPTPYTDARLEEVHRVPAPENAGREKALFLYRRKPLSRSDRSDPTQSA